jgi:Protein of unknown function (DUF4031)
MTILIDEPLWWFRGRKWSHLVSDESLEELHEFGARVGMPERAFQGDHYDVPEEYYDEFVRAGAVPTPSRELVRRLRAAGLRLSPAARRALLAGGEPVSPGGSPASAPVRPGDPEDTPDRPAR